MYVSKKFKKKICSLYQNCSPPRTDAIPKSDGHTIFDVEQVERNLVSFSVFQESEVRTASKTFLPIVQLRSNAFYHGVVFCVYDSLSFLQTRLLKPVII